MRVGTLGWFFLLFPFVVWVLYTLTNLTPRYHLEVLVDASASIYPPPGTPNNDKDGSQYRKAIFEVTDTVASGLNGRAWINLNKVCAKVESIPPISAGAPGTFVRAANQFLDKPCFGKGTNFTEGLRVARAGIRKTYAQSKALALIFWTDGEIINDFGDGLPQEIDNLTNTPPNIVWFAGVNRDKKAAMEALLAPLKQCIKVFVTTAPQSYELIHEFLRQLQKSTKPKPDSCHKKVR